MREKREGSQSCTATLRKPNLVVAGGARPIRNAASRLHLHGWDVVNVPAEDAVRAALSRKPSAMILPEDAGLESGYLVAAKLRLARPRLRVVLVGPSWSAKAERFAAFVGAGFVADTDELSELIAAIAG